jgi:hypothetical protein
MLQVAITFQYFLQVGTHFGHAMFQLMHLMFDLLQMTEGSQRRFVNG